MSESLRPARVSAIQLAKIALGISALGGVAGAFAGGMSALLVGAILDRGLRVVFEGWLFLVGAGIGAPLGALLLPIAALTLMRYVPFGRAFVGTVVGALIGGFIGCFITMDSHVLLRSIAGGIVGFVVAAILLRLRARATGEIAAGVV